LEESGGFPEREVSLSAVRTDPFRSEPDALLSLEGGEIAASPESPSGLHLRGAASDQTGYLLDGIPVFSPYHAGGTFSAWNPDALQRLQLSSASPSPEFADALAGTVLGITRTPSATERVEGALSTWQARASLDGPLGDGGAGYLLSYRTGFPGLVSPEGDPSYLSGMTRDLLAKAETPAAGGRLRLLFYDDDNALKGSASPVGDTVPNNLYQWHSQSIGMNWAGRAGSARLRLQAWTASSDADANWTLADSTAVTVTADRRDGGVLAAMERNAPAGTTTTGVRMEASRTWYRVSPAHAGNPSIDLLSGKPAVTLFMQHQQRGGRRLTLGVGGSTNLAAGGIYLALRSNVRWRVSGQLSLSATYSRSHQFAQSLRNPESVVRTVFPADLYVGAGAHGVPVPRSDRAVLSADYRPASGFRVGAQVYVSDYSGLLLVAPRTGAPFATTDFVTGSALAPGFSIEAGLSRPGFGVMADYAWQRVRIEYGDRSYTPSYAANNVIRVGAIVFPWRQTSIRLQGTGSFGRRATPVAGDFEWESCNVLDRGCQFAGSPHATDQLGASQLPAYLRLDLGLRRQWHVRLGGREVTLAMFATMSNVLGRHNLMAIATDPASGHQSAISMAPFAPLVAGIDWRF
ncbi:MAG TPA: TonB-dependent receptor plug domain-containing protein, partial [Gemmatimonadales bacterium]